MPAAGVEAVEAAPPPQPQSGLQPIGHTNDTGPLLTVCSVPLEPGERVVFFARPRHARQKVLYVVLGVLLAPLILGLAFVAYGLLYDRWHLRFVAVTNRRVVLQRGTKSPRWLRLADVSDVRAKRARAPSGAIGSLYPEASHGAKTDPKHWAEADAVVVYAKGGALSVEECVEPQLLGPALANALWTEGYLDTAPTVHHPS